MCGCRCLTPSLAALAAQVAQLADVKSSLRELQGAHAMMAAEMAHLKVELTCHTQCTTHSVHRPSAHC